MNLYKRGKQVFQNLVAPTLPNVVLLYPFLMIVILLFFFFLRNFFDKFALIEARDGIATWYDEMSIFINSISIILCVLFAIIIAFIIKVRVNLEGNSNNKDE